MNERDSRGVQTGKGLHRWKPVEPDPEGMHRDILVCPYCGQTNEPNMALCWSCGNSMDSGARVIETEELRTGNEPEGQGRIIILLVFLFMTGLLYLAGWIPL